MILCYSKKNKYSQSEPRNIFNNLTNYREPDLRSLKTSYWLSFFIFKSNEKKLEEVYMFKIQFGWTHIIFVIICLFIGFVAFVSWVLNL